MSRHSFSARRRPSAFTPTAAPRTDAPLPRTRLLAQAAALVNPPNAGIEGYPWLFDQQGVIEGLATVQLTPREIEIRIGRLIHASLNGRSTAMATEIVRHIEALCALRRLAEHWRRLVWLAVDSESDYFNTGGVLPCNNKQPVLMASCPGRPHCIDAPFVFPGSRRGLNLEDGLSTVQK